MLMGEGEERMFNYWAASGGGKNFQAHPPFGETRLQ